MGYTNMMHLAAPELERKDHQKHVTHLASSIVSVGSDPPVFLQQVKKPPAAKGRTSKLDWTEPTVVRQNAGKLACGERSSP